MDVDIRCLDMLVFHRLGCTYEFSAFQNGVRNLISPIYRDVGLTQD